MRIINTNDVTFENDFEEILGRAKVDIKQVSGIVQGIIDEIIEDGNEAVKRHIAKFDGWNPSSDEELFIDVEDMKKAYDNLDDKLRDSLHLAYDRIKVYHEKQLPKSWLDFEDNGTMLGQKVTPVDRAGLYIPGGKAAYPSSLLMNAVPAIVAGVEEIVVATPTPDNEPNELLLAACHLCGIKTVLKVGGASAVAAMAYGTGNMKKVDVITGPGNIFCCNS
jgi:histidinol dehydrogenase